MSLIQELMLHMQLESKINDICANLWKYRECVMHQGGILYFEDQGPGERTNMLSSGFLWGVPNRIPEIKCETRG